MKRLIKDGNAVNGIVKFDYNKGTKNTIFLLIGTWGLINSPGLENLLITAFLGFFTMYIGVVAYHRLIIHRSFKCPLYLEYTLTFIANLSGMGGPISLIKVHDLRDWAQRKEKCHPFFNHTSAFIIDGFQQLFCKIELKQPPEFKVEIAGNPFYEHLERFGILYQLPLAILLYFLGGVSLIYTGIFLRIFLAPAGHWLVAFCLHNYGQQPTINRNAGTQGYNIPLLALFTFGEAYHNNHHRFPDLACNQFHKGEIDPAWWLILLLKKLKLATQIKTID